MEGAPPGVRAGPDGICVDGRPLYLYGGELQYFRVRDRARTAGGTHALWRAALDAMARAGMNLVTTYVPWDVHEPARGQLAFDGWRDLGAFCELACERGFWLHLKPGPFINAEWPLGLGSFGAIPDWLRSEHPDCLVRRPDGRAWSFHPLGTFAGRQPSFLDPRFLAATRAWFAGVTAVLRPFIGRRPGAILWQLDNETNGFFHPRTRLDFSPAALGHLRRFLRARYGRVEQLNAAWGTGYGSFAEVRPPRRAPGGRRANRRTRDAYEAAQACIAEFLAILRGYWEELGVREPEVLFTTNDSPHLMPGSHHLLWDAPTKSASGAPSLDLYPRQLPWGKRPLDLPFLCEMWTQLFGAATPGGRALSAELQGGLFELPVGKIPVPPETTDQVLLKTVGHGLSVAAVYIIHGGLNRDDSRYDFQAALDADGLPGPRYEVLRRWGERVFGPHGERLLTSRPVHDPVVILYDADQQVPQHGLGLDPARLAAELHGAAWGWLAQTGCNAELRDLRATGPEHLRGKAVLWLQTGQLRPAWAALLDDFLRAGGRLLSFGSAALRDLDGRCEAPALRRLAARFGARGLRRYRFSAGRWEVGADRALRVAARGFRERCTPPADATPLLWEPRWLGGRCLGFRREVGAGRLWHLGCFPFARFGDGGYYRLGADELEAHRRWCGGLLAEAGIAPALDCPTPHGIAWGRRLPAGAFLFAVHDGEGKLAIRLRKLAAFGLEEGARYRIDGLLHGESLTTRSGKMLRDEGIQLELPRHGCEVVWLRPVAAHDATVS